MMTFLDSINVTYQVVLTKSDLVTPVDLARRASLLKTELDKRRHGIKQIVIVSARTKQGVPHLRSHLLGLADIKFHEKSHVAAKEPSLTNQAPTAAVQKKTAVPARTLRRPSRSLSSTQPATLHVSRRKSPNT